MVQDDNGHGHYAISQDIQTNVMRNLSKCFKIERKTLSDYYKTEWIPFLWQKDDLGGNRIPYAMKHIIAKMDLSHSKCDYFRNTVKCYPNLCYDDSIYTFKQDEQIYLSKLVKKFLKLTNLLKNVKCKGNSGGHCILVDLFLIIPASRQDVKLQLIRE